MTIEVRPASTRFLTEAESRTTWHSFSFGAHYDPHNVTFGALVAHNDERLPAGTGYPDHPHRDTEIVTVVLSGALRHTDSSGHTGLIEPGQVQRLSAGSGVVHSEVSEPSQSGEETRFIQAWVRPDESDVEPSWAQARGLVTPTDGLLTLAGPGGAVDIGARGAALHLGGAPAGGRLRLPEAARLHVFVLSGSVSIGDHRLDDGDAARLIHEGGRALTIEDGAAAEVLVWALP